VTASGIGNPTVNSNPQGALIEITDSAGQPVYIGGVLQTGFTTPHEFTGIAAGSYYVRVSKSCYWPSPSTLITVTGGGSHQNLNAITLNAMPTTGTPPVCVNDAPSGSIAITSQPAEGYHVFIDGKSMGYDTPVLQEIGVGEHSVRLEIPGYISETKEHVIVKAGELTRADFVLTKKSDVPVKTLIVPNPLNIGRTGYFLALVMLPTGYKATDVDAESVYCEGAKALKLVRIKLFPQIFVAIFQRQDLGNYPTGTQEMKVWGLVKKNNDYDPFLGIYNVNIINKKSTTKEDVDTVMTMTDTQIFTKFNKF
jgi:hypothetical protein